MPVPKLLKTAVIDIPSYEIQQLYSDLKDIWEERLQSSNVKFPKFKSAKSLWLVFLYKYKKQLVHKDTISEFVQTQIQQAGKDQQIRHLARDGWYLLNKGEWIPDTEREKVPSGYHYLYSVDSPKPTFIKEKLKRINRLTVKDFNELKIIYKNRCATCGSEEGKPQYHFSETQVILQKGHMDPRESLTLKNTIPQCQL